MVGSLRDGRCGRRLKACNRLFVEIVLGAHERQRLVEGAQGGERHVANRHVPVRRAFAQAKLEARAQLKRVPAKALC